MGDSWKRIIAKRSWIGGYNKNERNTICHNIIAKRSWIGVGNKADTCYPFCCPHFYNKGSVV